MASRNWKDLDHPNQDRRSASPSYSPPRTKGRTYYQGSSFKQSRSPEKRHENSESKRKRSRSRSRDRGGPWSRRRSRSRSRDHDAVDRKRSRSRDRNQFSDGPSRSRTFRSPDRSKVKSEVKNEMKVEGRIRSPVSGVPRTQTAKYSQEELVSIQTLHCAICSVSLGDPGSMRSHLDGRPHLAQKQKISDRNHRVTYGVGLSDSMTTKKEHFGVDDNYWLRMEGEEKQKMFTGDKKLHEVYDEKRYDRMQARFNRKDYDHGQFKDSRKYLYCEVCGVTVATRDVMESHKQGKEHQRQVQEAKRYECKICNITVPCQNTLDSHMRGKDHIKKENQINEEQRRNKRMYGQIKPEPGRDDRQYLESLTSKNEKLKTEWREVVAKNKECIDKHHEEIRACRDLEKLHAEIENLEYEKESLTEKIAQIKLKYPPKSSSKKAAEKEYTEAEPEVIDLD